VPSQINAALIASRQQEIAIRAARVAQRAELQALAAAPSRRESRRVRPRRRLGAVLGVLSVARPQI
jgi:hypothetical protein